MNLFDTFRHAADLSSLREPSAESWCLANILGVRPSELDAIRLGRRYHYRPFAVAKRDGRTRQLFAPSPALIRLQRALLKNHLGRLRPHRCATAFFPGASTTRHAWPHTRNALVVTADLRDFFGTTAAARVRRLFLSQGWRGAELGALMRLCLFRGALPQGAPTSPCLSNLVNAGLDERIARLASRAGAVYTRYGDDLAFSWPEGPMPGGFTVEVDDVLASAGYEVQPLKGWKITRASERPVVTGIVLAGDGRLRVPFALRLRTAALRWRSWWPGGGDARARLQGYEGYLRMIERPS